MPFGFLWSLPLPCVSRGILPMDRVDNGLSHHSWKLVGIFGKSILHNFFYFNTIFIIFLIEDFVSLFLPIILTEYFRPLGKADSGENNLVIIKARNLTLITKKNYLFIYNKKKRTYSWLLNRKMPLKVVISDFKHRYLQMLFKLLKLLQLLIYGY